MPDEQDSANTTDTCAAAIHEEIVDRSRGMSDGLREELFAQRRLLLKGFEQTPPTLVVNSAEGTTIFRGLNHTRKLMGPVNRALEAIVKDPAKVIAEYETKFHAARQREAGD